MTSRIVLVVTLSVRVQMSCCWCRISLACVLYNLTGTLVAVSLTSCRTVMTVSDLTNQTLAELIILGGLLFCGLSVSENVTRVHTVD